MGAEESDGSWEAVAAAVRLKCADKFAAVIGLPGPVAKVNAAAIEMGLDALGKPFAGAFGAAGGEGQKEPAAADLAGVPAGRDG